MYRYILFGFFICFALPTAWARASWDTLWITKDEPSPDFTPNQALLYDSLGNFTIEQVSSPIFQPKFKFVETYWRDDGLVAEVNVYWSRIVVINQHKWSDYVIRMAEVLDTVTLYVPNEKKGFDAYTIGRNFPLSERIIHKAQGFALPLYLPQKDTAITIYLRAVKNNNYYTSIGGVAGIVDSTESLFNEWTKIRFRMGFFLGMLLIAVFIANIYYWVIRFQTYRFYPWDAIFTLLFAFDNMELYVELGLPVIEGLSWLIRMLMFSFRILFALQFLSIRERYPDIYRLILVFLVAALAIGLTNVFSLDTYRESIALFAYISLLFMLHTVAIWQLFRQEDRRHAYYFLTANLIVDISIFFVLFEGNFMTISVQNTYYLSLLGEIIRIIIFTIGISHEVRQKEKQVEAEKQEKELQLLAERFEREREKKHLARELHDNMGMQLTRLLFEIERSKQNNSGQVNLQKMHNFVHEAIYELREAIWVIGKEDIYLKDWVNRIESMLEKTLEQNGELDFQLLIDNQLNERLFSPLESLNLYRIFQETLQNILKHSQATLIQFRIQVNEAKQIVIAMKDNGIGTSNLYQSEGNGVKNMKQRAKEINATLEITNVAPNGMQVLVTLS